MKKPVIIILLFQLVLSYCCAQDSKNLVHAPDSMIKVIPFGRHEVYSIDGKIQSPLDIRMRLLSYQPSAVEYNSAKSNLTWAFVSTGAAGVCSIGAILEYGANNKLNGVTLNSNGTFNYQQHSYTAAYILTGAAVGFITAQIICFVKGATHSRRAIKAYNLRFE